MGIELRITSSTAQGESTTSTKQLNDNDITVGCYNDDSVKLESELLQGSHVRISSEWNSETDEQCLIITNISGNTSIFLDNEALESDEYREIKQTTDIRLGNYRLAVRDTSLNYFATVEDAQSDFALENFSPNEFSLDTAMKSLLQPSETMTTQAPDIESIAELQTVETQDSTLVEQPRTTVSSVTNLKQPSAPLDAVTPTIPTLKVKNEAIQTTDVAKIVSLNHDAIKTEQDMDVTVNSPEKQTLFEGVVGTDDIVELNFDAYRLYSISGQIIHHNQPLAGVVLDGGPLGVARTNANGNFSFENIVEGSNYQINVSCDGYMMAKTQVLFGTINHNIEHNLNAIKLSRVTGRIVHDGTPLPSVTLDAGPYGICLTDANGYYHFDNVPENTDLEIRALGAGFMFKRAGTATGVSHAPANAVATAMSGAINTPDNSDKEMEDSLAALVGNRQNVA